MSKRGRSSSVRPLATPRFKSSWSSRGISPSSNSCLIARRFLAQGGLTEKPHLQGDGIVRILEADRVECVAHALTATSDDLAGEPGDAHPEDRAQAAVVEGQELVDQQARHQQQLDTVGEAIGDEPHDAEMPIEEIGDMERGGKRQRQPGRLAVTGPAFGARAFDQVVGIAQQHLHGGRRSDAVGPRLEGQHALLVRQGNQGDGEPVAFAQGLGRIADIRCRDPGLIGLG